MNKTRIALLNKAISLAGSYRIAYPNTGFEPVQGETYLKFDFVPADDSPVTLGSTGEDELTGFYVITSYSIHYTKLYERLIPALVLSMLVMLLHSKVMPTNMWLLLG